MKHSRTARAWALVIAIVLLFIAVVPATLAYVMTATEPLINIFIPETTEEPEPPDTTAPEPPDTDPPRPPRPPVTTEPIPTVTYSDLDIGAEIDHPFGDDYVPPKDLSFEVEVDLGPDLVGETVLIDGVPTVVGEDGKITVTVKPDAPVNIDQIPVGTEVTATLKNGDDSGFTLDNGEDSKDVVIRAEIDNRVDFLNVYRPSGFGFGDFVTLNGLKVLEGRDWKDGDSFSFLLEIKRGEEWVELGTATVTYDPNDPEFAEFSFTETLNALRLDAAGVYTFRLTEVIGDLPDIVYDKTVNYIDAVVGDRDMDGRLELQNLVLPENAEFVYDAVTGRYELMIVFNNAYKPTDKPNNITVDVNVKHEITGDEVDPEDNEFEFILENVGTEDEAVKITDEDGNLIFELIFTPEDIGKTFHFELTQKPGDLDGMDYSDKVYKIEITIGLDENNRLTADIKVDGETVEEEDLNFVFESSYDPTSYAWLWFLLIPLTDKIVALIIALIIRKRYEDKLLGV